MVLFFVVLSRQKVWRDDASLGLGNPGGLAQMLRSMGNSRLIIPPGETHPSSLTTPSRAGIRHARLVWV